MKARWLLNLVLLVAVIGIAAFLHFRHKPVDATPKEYPVSNLASSNFSQVTIEFPTKKSLQLEKRGGHWFLLQPYPARANEGLVRYLLAIAAATSKEKFPATKAPQYGLDNPVLKVRLDDAVFSFGIHQPLTSEQYMGYKDGIYLVPNIYGESASLQVAEFVDKHPLAASEDVAGFDFSHLEQWENNRLNLDLIGSKWKVSVANANSSQDALNEWYESSWRNLAAQSTEPYTPDGKPHPSLEVKLKNGKTVHLDKIEEMPELLLARPDEKILYHFPKDTGFTILNPPVGIGK